MDEGDCRNNFISVGFIFVYVGACNILNSDSGHTELYLKRGGKK